MTPESYILSGSIQVVEHFFTVPLDYSEPEGKKLRIFARHLVPLQKARTAEEQSKLPFLLYLQGGPGFECDLESSVQIGAPIHERGYQTLWLDSRGTGLSTPFSAELVMGMSDIELFEYLKHFRADNIVR